MNTPSGTRDNGPPPSPEHDQSEEATVWFVRLRSGRMTRQEWTQFESWRNQDPAHERVLREIGSLWETPELIEAAVEIDQTARRSGFFGMTRSRWVRTLAVAATVLLVIIAVAQQLDLPLRLQADYMTATGERHTLTLADRSTVTLNTSSAVATTYRADERQVRLLKGEALFRVQADKTRPFWVEHQGMVARAIGTSFVVRERGGKIQVTVIEGVVAVQPAQQTAAPLMLTAGQQALMETNGAASVQSINPDLTLAWLKGRLVFDTTPFSEVLQEIARYHPGYVGLWNPALAHLRVSGTYNLSNTSNILATLQQTLPVHMTRLTDHFIVFR